MRLLEAVVAVIMIAQVGCRGGVVRMVRVRSEVGHRYAITWVTARLANPHPRPMELRFRVRLPREAYVTELTIESGGRNYTTVIKPKPKHPPRPTAPPTPHSNTNNTKPKTSKKFSASAAVGSHAVANFYLKYEELLQRVKGHYTHRVFLDHSVPVVDVEVTVAEAENITNLSVRYPGERRGRQYTGQKEVLGPGRVLVWYKTTNTSHDGEDRNTDAEAIGNRESINGTGDSSDNTNDEEELDDDEKYDEDSGALSIYYDVERKPDGGEIQVGGRFFVHYVCPEGLARLPAHTVFVLDVSGSMSDLDKLDHVKGAMESILANLHHHDSFEVLVFSTRVTSLGVFGGRGRDIARGVAKIRRLQALGGTNFQAALVAGVDHMNRYNDTPAAKQMVFLTDGQPNLGETKSEVLRRTVREANVHNHPIHALAFGGDADDRFLRQVSTDNHGFTRKIDAVGRPTDQLKGFFQEISTPLITDVDVVYLEDEVEPNSVVKRGTSTYYSGDEVVYAGRLADGATDVQPIVTGRGAGGPLQFRVSRVSTNTAEPDNDNSMERLWAYLTVQDLLSMHDVVHDANLRQEMRLRAIDIAVKFQFLTRLTSLDVQQQHPDDQGLAPLLKSAMRPRGSLTVRLPNVNHDLTLLSASEFAKTLPPPLHGRLDMTTGRTFSFGDNDPHFVVAAPGMALPLCFDIHGKHGDVFSLVQDPGSGIVVNGQVSSAIGRGNTTYFTKIFIAFKNVNLTVTPDHITIDCLDHRGQPKVDRAATSLWPFKIDRRPRYPRAEKHRTRRKTRKKSSKRGWRGRKKEKASKSVAESKRNKKKRRGGRSSGAGQGVVRWRRSLHHPHSVKYPHRTRMQGQTSRPHPHPHAHKYPSNINQENGQGNRETEQITDGSISTSTVTQHLATAHVEVRRPIRRSKGSKDKYKMQDAENRNRGFGRFSVGEARNAEVFSDLREVCNSTFKWKKMAGRRYGEVVVGLRNHRKLEVLMGDVAAHFLVTRSIDRHGQPFLGFYVEEQNVLSPNTTGIIGQFAFKTVGTLPDTSPVNATRPHLTPPHTTHPHLTPPHTTRADHHTPDGNNTRVELSVVHSTRQYRVSTVTGFISSRRSLAHKTHVTCLHVRNHGQGLLDAHPDHYLRPCLTC